MSARDQAGDKAPLAFINARLIDPETRRDEPGGLVVRAGLIADLVRTCAAPRRRRSRARTSSTPAATCSAPA